MRVLFEYSSLSYSLLFPNGFSIYRGQAGICRHRIKKRNEMIFHYPKDSNSNGARDLGEPTLHTLTGTSQMKSTRTGVS